MAAQPGGITALAYRDTPAAVLRAAGGVAENIRQVEIYRLYKQEELIELGEIERHLREDHPDDPDQPYYLLTVDYGKKVVQACLDWCDESLANLQKMDEQG
jgi:hypothetical protein